MYLIARGNADPVSEEKIEACKSNQLFNDSAESVVTMPGHALIISLEGLKFSRDVIFTHIIPTRPSKNLKKNDSKNQARCTTEHRPIWIAINKFGRVMTGYAPK